MKPPHRREQHAIRTDKAGSGRGHLHVNTILQDGPAVWRCWQYIEMNPVRAHLVQNPADYRWCSFGVWNATGRHPFEDAVRSCAFERLRVLLGVESMQELPGRFTRRNHSPHD